MTTSFLAPILLLAAGALYADFRPGDIFRDHTYANRFSVCDPGVSHPGALKMCETRKDVEVNLDIEDLTHAVRAEVLVEYWGGHIGTSGQRLRANGGAWIDIPQPSGTPTPPQCYYRTVLGRPAAEIPLAELKPGRNTFQFAAGPQICHSFNWGFYWVYSFTVRVYYGPEKRHPQGEMVGPANGSTIGEKPWLAARITTPEPHAEVRQVDFFGLYDDFNWEGNGPARQWHYRTEKGFMTAHIGTATAAPWHAQWDTTWLPDQDRPVQLAARITDTMGVSYITQPVEARFRRTGRSVRMYTCAQPPEKFGVRIGREKKGTRLGCTIQIDGPREKARLARLVMSSWSGAHGEDVAINGKRVVERIGPIHNYSFDSIPVGAGMFQQGPNEFSIYSSTEHHAFEINWPGPAVLIEYRDAPVPDPAKPAWAQPVQTGRIPIRVEATGFARLDKPVEADVALPAGVAPSSLRLVEIDGGVKVVDASVPLQLDGARVVFVLKGQTPPDAVRFYHLYFGGKPSGPAAAPAQSLKVEDGVEWQGQTCFRVTTPVATYYYQKEGAGFARIDDRDGNDWIGYKPGGRSAGEFRGIPNMGEFSHPGYTGATGSTSVIVAQGPLKVAIRSERRDGRSATLWEFYHDHARLTVLRAGLPYWILYEGTPGGKLDLEDDYLIHSTGERMPASMTWDYDLPGPEWVAFGDRKLNRVLYLASHQEDDQPDQYWPMEGNMTVFGFGRRLRTVHRFFEHPGRFTVGLVEASDFDRVAAGVNSAYRDIRVVAGPAEKK